MFIVDSLIHIFPFFVGMQLRLPSFSKNGFFASSSIIFAGSLVVNVLNYVFTLLMSRMMGVEAFGEVTAIGSLLLVIAVPSSALSMLMTREVAFRKNTDIHSVRDLFFFLQKHAVITALGLWVVFVLMIPFLSTFLRIPYTPLFIFSALLPLLGIGALQTGALQGLHEFFRLSKQNIVSAVIKLAVSIVLVRMGFSVSGVMIALVLAQFASWLYGHVSTRSTLGSKPTNAESFNSAGMGMLFSSILCTVLLLALLSNIDVLLAKHFLSSTEAGQYGALSTLGKIIIYGVGAFATVLLPMASAAHAQGNGEEKRVLALSVSVIGAASVAAWALFSLFPDVFVSVLFGARYSMIGAELGMFSIAMGCVALATTLINYFIAIRNHSFVYVLGCGIAFEVLLISLNHDSVRMITNMLVIASGTLLVLMALNYWYTVQKKIV